MNRDDLRDDIYAVVLRRLQHPTAQTVEEAATQITDDLIAALPEMGGYTTTHHVDVTTMPPLSVAIRGRDETWVYTGAAEDAPALDIVEKAALLALLDHIRGLLQPHRTSGGFIPVPQQPLVTWTGGNGKIDYPEMGSE